MRRPGISAGLVIGALLVVLAISVIACIGLGAVRIAPAAVLGIVRNAWLPGEAAVSWTLGQSYIVLDLRVPRVLLGAIVGAGLAMVGAVLQPLTRNPLADPYLFGISSGASVGAVAVILFASGGNADLMLTLAAFAGAIAAMALVFALGRDRGGFSPERLILTGVAVHFILMAITNALLLSAPDRGAESALFWMLGGFANARWAMLAPAFAVLLIGFVWIMARGGALDALSLGDEGAHTLGVPVHRIRVELFLATALVTGAMVSTSGSVGFIGLIVPHVARWVAGGRTVRVVPVAALIGAIFAIWADVAARSLFAPRELPLGVMTAAAGGLFFLLILRRRRLG